MWQGQRGRQQAQRPKEPGSSDSPGDSLGLWKETKPEVLIHSTHQHSELWPGGLWPEAHLSHTTWLREDFLHGHDSGRLAADAPLKMSKGQWRRSSLVGTGRKASVISPMRGKGRANIDTVNDAANDIRVEKNRSLIK